MIFENLKLIRSKMEFIIGKKGTSTNQNIEINTFLDESGQRKKRNEKKIYIFNPLTPEPLYTLLYNFL